MFATQPSRLDIYRLIHKALRHQMFDTLIELGRVDIDSASAVTRCADKIDTLLQALRNNIWHENEYIHPAIEAYCPGGTMQVNAQHVDHLEVIIALERKCNALRNAEQNRRGAVARQLYRYLSLQIAHSLHHMDMEESNHNTLLWQYYDDAALKKIHSNILTSLTANEMSDIQYWFGLTATPQEMQIFTNSTDHHLS